MGHLLTCIALAPLLCAGPVSLTGDTLPEDRGAAGLRRALLELRTTATVLHIVAHPDDEDAGLLTWLARSQGARVILLSLTRGEGGANLISADSFEALGALRTLELLEACRRYGAELFFTRAFDYGYSKSLDEARERWDEDAILADVVRVIRRERPDIIISRFRGSARDGHGQHAYAGVMAIRAFEEAARGGDFDVEGEVLRPWQPAKLYLPASRDDKGSVAAPTGDHDPVLGRSYHQLGREGYSLHRSQGMAGAPASPGARDAVYRLERAADPGYTPEKEASFFDGLNTSIREIAARWGDGPPEGLISSIEALSIAVDRALERFNAVEPWKTAELLVEALRAARSAIAAAEESVGADAAKRDVLTRLRRKEAQLQTAIALSLGIHFDAVAELQGQAAPGTGPPSGGGFPLRHAVPGQKLDVRVRIVNPSPLEVFLKHDGVRPSSFDRPGKLNLYRSPRLLARNAMFESRIELDLLPDAPLSKSGQSLMDPRASAYISSDPRAHSLPIQGAAAGATIAVDVLDETILIDEPVRCAYLDPVRGHLRPPLAVVPALSVSFDAPRGFLRAGIREYPVRAVVRSSVNEALEGAVVLRVPAGWAAEPVEREFRLERDGEEASLDFRVSVPEGPLDGVHEIAAMARSGGQEYVEGYRTITARDLGRFDHYAPATHSLTIAPVEVAPDLRIGYVMGTGDDVPRGLERLGCAVKMLGSDDLAGGDLSGLDAVLIGIRAHAVRADVRAHNARLLEYVEGGGVLVVQYQTPEFDRSYGPYPYSMTGNPEEVSEENAPVTILAPENPVLSAPNRIGPADFEGWIEQRGSKFLESWDERYTPLLECRDRGQEPQMGGLIYARHGKGVWIYNAYAGYRQLPFGVPGAYRLYANMVSLRRTLGG